MKSTAMGVLLSIVALVGVGVLYLRLDSVEAEVRLLTQARSLTPRTAVEAEASAGYGAPPTAEAGDRPTRGRGGAAAASEPAGDGAERRSAASSPRSIEARLEQLEQERDARRTSPGISYEVPRFARSVDDLAKSLNLSSTQKDRISACVERGKRRIEDLLKIPEADGRSPWEKREEQRRKLEEALKAGTPADLPGTVLTAGLGGRGYRNNRIPGRNATYGEEIDRIKRETRSEIEADLDAGQRETFQKTRTDALLGEGGGMAMSLFTAGGGDGASIAIEMAEEVLEVPPPPQAGK